MWLLKWSLFSEHFITTPTSTYWTIHSALLIRKWPSTFLTSIIILSNLIELDHLIIIRCIGEYLKSKTVILVTHQIQFIKKAAKVLVLKEGQPLHYGSYKELMEKGIDFMSLIEEKPTDNEKSSEVESSHEKTRSFSEESLRNRTLSVLSTKSEVIFNEFRIFWIKFNFVFFSQIKGWNRNEWSENRRWNQSSGFYKWSGIYGLLESGCRSLPLDIGYSCNNGLTGTLSLQRLVALTMVSIICLHFYWILINLFFNFQD